MRNLFKLILLILSLIPLYFGLSGALGGALSLNGGEAVSANLENQFRYLSGFYLTLAFLIWWFLRDIDNRGTVLALIVGAIFIGGLARLYCHFAVGPAEAKQIGGMVLELSSPLLIVWQRALARSVGPVIP